MSLSDLAPAQASPARPRRLRRVSTAREASDLTVARVLPLGHVRPATQGQWSAHAQQAIDAAHGLRSDRKRTLWAVAQALMRWADWDTLTTRPTWAVLTAACRTATGCGSRATTARHIATLIEMNLIARVAHGRQGQYAPGDQTTNEAAVYVLVVPSPIRAVDEPETPPGHPAVSETHPAHAHAREEPPTEPLRGTEPPAAPAVPRPSGAPCRQLPAWPGSVPALRKEHRVIAADELRSRLPVLRLAGPDNRPMSSQDIAATLRPWFVAGWTVLDVLQALDQRPDGTRWPHDGATGVAPPGGTTPSGTRGGPRGWLKHRLAPWTTDGTVQPSPSQRRAAEHARDLARHQALTDQTTTEPTGPGSSLAAHVRWHQHTPSADCRWCTGCVIGG